MIVISIPSLDVIIVIRSNEKVHNSSKIDEQFSKKANESK